MNIVYKARYFLVNLGKMLPFVLCFIVCISYTETIYSILQDNYLTFYGYITPNKPISFWIGQYFEYDLMTLFVVLTLSVAIETCYWNKLAIVYLCLQLYEKDYFESIELYQETICIIALANIIASGFFVYKGVSMLINKH